MQLLTLSSPDNAIYNAWTSAVEPSLNMRTTMETSQTESTKAWSHILELVPGAAARGDAPARKAAMASLVTHMAEA